VELFGKLSGIQQKYLVSQPALEFM